MSRIPFFGVLLAFALVAGLVSAPSLVGAQGVNADIAFTTGRGTEVFEVWSMEEDGSGSKRLIGGPPGSIEVDPDVNVVGTEIVFARKSGNDETFDLMVKTLGAPGDATRITDENGTVSNDRQPAWAPTQSRIAFTRMIRAQNTSNIWAVNGDGSGLTQLTETPAPAYDASPTWSSDGTKIAFVSDRSGMPQVYVMDAGGVTETQITFDPCFHADPVWHPTESRLLFAQLCPGSPTGWDLVSMTPVPGSVVPFVATTDNELQPGWAPMGDGIVFTRYPAGGGDKRLFTADANGANESSSLADHPAVDMSADWSTATTVTAAEAEVQEAGSRSADDAETRDRLAPKKKGKKKKQEIPKRVIKGVRYREMRMFKSDVYVLKVAAKRIPRLDVSLSNDLLPGREKTRNMAKRHKAVAGINGDFGTPSGRPSHTFAEDGDLKQVSFAVAPTFAMTQDEATVHVARPFETVTAVEHDDWPVDRWNFGEPGATEISAFTPSAGSLELPPANACSARLQAAGGQRWAPGLAGVQVDYAVTEVTCATTAVGAPGPGQVVLSGQPGTEGGTLVGSLSVGETVTLTWSIGFAGVLDTVGGTPLLVENGAAVVPKPCTSSICKTHPRTGIGVTPSGRILMVVVDGRREGSRGVTLVRFAKVFQKLRASFAMNLDGGGSSTMVVRGKKGGLKVVNQPSDGGQRKVSSAVLVIKGKDPGESIGGPLAAPLAPAPPPARDRGGEIAAMDPASTGGLAEALVSGTFGPRVDLPRELRRALRIFRSAS
ncbi:MAG: phosphodiester glycosidase family protein [Actinomycetota bacterium]